MSDSIRMSVSSSDGRGPIFNSVSTPSTFSIIRALMPPYQPGQPQLWPRHCGSGEQCKAHRARRSTHVLVGGPLVFRFHLYLWAATMSVGNFNLFSNYN